MKIIKAESDKKKKRRGEGSERAKAGAWSKGWRERGESSVVSRERAAGDGRIMTEGGACLTSADLSAGKS